MGPIAVGCALLFAGLATTGSLIAEEEGIDFEEELAFRQAVERIGPSVVRIETVGGLDRIGEQRLGTGATTGLVVGAEGWILTSSFNFLGKPSGIIVVLPEGEKLAAKVVASDLSCHLTLLKIDKSGLPMPRGVPRAQWRVGQWAIAIGRSYASPAPSLSAGILSAVDRIHGKALQTDAKVSPVNYGGPLVDLQGDVLGILVPLSPDGKDDLAGIEWYDSGIGFAIPLERIERVLPRLQAGEDLTPGLAGFSLKNPKRDGTIVERVRAGSPAFQAGIRSGDRIVELDGKLMRRDAQMRQVLGGKYAGDPVRVRYQRGATTEEVELTLAGKLAAYEMPALGVLLKKDDGKEGGLTVRGIVPGSAAAEAGLQGGDRIVEWGGKLMTQRGDLEEQLFMLQPGDESDVTLLRGSERVIKRVKLGSAVEATVARGEPVRVASQPAKVNSSRVRVEDFEREHWTLEPSEMALTDVQTLLVWIHPPGNSMEQAMQDAWKGACDGRGIAILAPILPESRNWDTDDLEYLSKLIEFHCRRYGLGRERVVVMGGKGTGAFPLFVGGRFLENVGGVVLSDSQFDLKLGEVEPESVLKVCVLGGETVEGGEAAGILGRFDEVKIPHVSIPMVAEATSPEGKTLEQLIDWVDSTDRL